LLVITILVTITAQSNEVIKTMCISNNN